MISPWQGGRNICFEGHAAPHDIVQPNRHDHPVVTSPRMVDFWHPFRCSGVRPDIWWFRVAAPQANIFRPIGTDAGHHVHSIASTGNPHILRDRLELMMAHDVKSSNSSRVMTTILARAILPQWRGSMVVGVGVPKLPRAAEPRRRRKKG